MIAPNSFEISTFWNLDMIYTSLLYVSTSLLSASEVEAGVDAIVDTAQRANPSYGLTGSLLFTGTHFAQVLEGRGAQLDELMARIRRDSRHHDVLVVDRSAISERRFSNWSMAFCGPSQFVERHVGRLLRDPAAPEKSRSAAWLTDVMHEMTSLAVATE